MSENNKTPEWAILLGVSTERFRVGKGTLRESSKYLWLGAKEAIKDWAYSTDPTGERLYQDVLTALGGTRRSSASKVKTVALAVAHFGLDLDAYGSLNRAYDEARRMAVGSTTEVDPPYTCTCRQHGSH